MKALIVGGAGFVGKYLIDHLRNDRKWSVCVTKLPEEVLDAGSISAIDPAGITVVDLDILDQAAIRTVLQNERPDYIFHLAAQSSVAVSWRNPALTVDVNVKGTVNLLEAIRESEAISGSESINESNSSSKSEAVDKSEAADKSEETNKSQAANKSNADKQLKYKPKVLLVGSGEEYGPVSAGELPINEENPIRPGNIYAASKACQTMLGKIYADAYGLNVIMVRAFNHIGPGQPPAFVVPDFCRQAAEIEKGLKEPVIRVGNLSAKRDFTDVRDVVRAYSLLIERGAPGETYNVGSGNAVCIEEILNVILELAHLKISVETDPAKYRPVDVPVIEADIQKLQQTVGWNPVIGLRTTIADTLQYWRDVAGPGGK